MPAPPRSHQDLILEQFTRQAAPFSTAKAIADERALQLLVEFSGAGREDTLLDVGCGGGLVVCAFARAASYELRDELDNLLRGSFPNPGDDVRIREIFAASAIDDRLGISIRRDQDRIHYAYPVAMLAANR